MEKGSLKRFFEETVPANWEKIPVRLRAGVALALITGLALLVNWLGYGATAPRAFVATLLVIPIILKWANVPNKWLVWSFSFFIALIIGWRQPFHGSANDMDVAVRAMVWGLYLHYLVRLIKGDGKKKHEKE